LQTTAGPGFIVAVGTPGLWPAVEEKQIVVPWFWFAHVNPTKFESIVVCQVKANKYTIKRNPKQKKGASLLRPAKLMRNEKNERLIKGR